MATSGPGEPAAAAPSAAPPPATTAAAPPADPVNPDLLERIPLAAKLVLDVGCAAGALGWLYKRWNPAARVMGIEIDPQAAAIARTRLDEVVVGDVEAMDAPFRRHGPLDCIIYGDVLEHLRDPVGLLAAHAQWLAPDGVMLICVPNLEHWVFTARLLAGTWAYEPSGLLDAGHLRWFTAATMARALRDAGMTIVDVTPRIFEPEAHQAYVAAVTPVLTALGVDPADYARRSAPLQLVWRVRRSPFRPLNVVAHMLPPEGGVSHVRVVYPVRAIATDPTVRTRVITSADLPDLPPDEPRVLVLHRLVVHGAGGIRTLRGLLRRGYVIVMEFDDNPEHMRVLQQPELHTFRGVHAVQTTTPALAEVIGRANPHVQVFPNAVAVLPPPRNFVRPPMQLFFGGFNRQHDWAPCVEALNAVTAIAGDRLRIQVVHDEAFFQALQTPHKDFTPTLDYPAYLERLGQCELAFMPLLDTAFNRCKSDLKFLEAAAARVCAVASPVVYGASIQDMQTGVLFSSPDELRQRLLRLVANPELALGMAERAHAWVARHRMLAYQTAARVAWYRSLWERREALTADLLARLPELADPAAGPPLG